MVIQCSNVVYLKKKKQKNLENIKQDKNRRVCQIVLGHPVRTCVHVLSTHGAVHVRGPLKCYVKTRYFTVRGGFALINYRTVYLSFGTGIIAKRFFSFHYDRRRTSRTLMAYTNTP